MLLLAVAGIAYFPALSGNFLWDDPGHVSENATLRSVDGLRRIWFEIGATQQYYPMVFTSFWLEYQLWGLTPLGYHLTNVLLHVGSGVLLWRLLDRFAVPGAFAAAAVFVVHPVHVESVAWITERKNVLSLLFYLAAARLYLPFVFPPADTSGQRRARCYALAVVLFAMALGSKTVTCTWPAAMLLVVWWRNGRIRRQDVVALSPFFAVGIGLGLVTVWLEKTQIGASGADWSLGLVDRCLLASRIPWFYAGKLCWPFDLTFVYPRWQVDHGVWWQYLFALALLAAIGALWYWRWMLGRGPLVAVLFFVGSLFPALGFFDVYPMRFSYVADHFQYLASIGVLAALAAAGTRAAVRTGLRRAGPAAGIAVVAVLTVLSWHRSHVFRDNESLWRDTLARNPAAWIAHNNLAEILLEQGRFDAALAACRAAIEAKPDFANPRSVIGSVYFRQGRFAEAATHYRTAIALDPKFWSGHYNLANTLFRLGEFERAAEHYQITIRQNPRHSGAHHNLGVLYEQVGQRRRAAAELRRSLVLEPGSASAALALARVLATDPQASPAEGDEAVALAEAVTGRPGGRNASALQVLAAAQARSGRFAVAVTTASEAIDVARTTGDTELAEAVAAQLERYRQGQAIDGD